MDLEIFLILASGSHDRGFAYGAMGCQINPSWWTYRAISHFVQCSMTGATKAVVCAILSVGWCIYKIPSCYFKSGPGSGSRFSL